MSRVTITDSLLTAIADAIRAKTGGQASMTPAEMAQEIADISSGISYEDIAERKYSLPIDLGNAEKVMSYAFNNIQTQTRGTVTGANVISIGNGAFGQSASLTGDVTGVYFPECMVIYGSAFQKSKITEAVFPKLVNMPESSVFMGCNALVRVNMPLITTINGSIFSECTALTDVKIPSARSLGNMAFYGCTALTQIALPAASSINSYAFFGCTALADIYVPFAEGAVAGAPWGATNATIHYGCTFDSNGNVISG